MHEQVEYVDGSRQFAVDQHQGLLSEMGCRYERCQTEQHRGNDKNTEGNSIYQGHEQSSPYISRYLVIRDGRFASRTRIAPLTEIRLTVHKEGFLQDPPSCRMVLSGGE